MPTIHTQPGSVVFGAGKNLGQIAAEREQYTRGAEQARMDLQKQRIKNAQTERALARIDADEKETRRQQEWDAIAKRAKEAADESKRRWEEEQRTKGEMTDYQKQIIEAKKRAEQERIDKIKRNEDMIKGMLQEQAAQPAVTQPTVTQLAQTEDEKWTAGVESWTQKQARLKFKEQYPNATMETARATQEPIAQPAPTPVQKSLQDQYIEGVKKQITPIDAEYKKKLRVKAVSDVYNPKASASQNEMRIKSKYNELLKTAKEKNTEANLKLISAKSKIEVAKQKAEKANQKEKKAIEKEMKKAGKPTQAQITLAKQALSTDGLGAGYTAEEMEKHTKWAKGIQARVIAMGGVNNTQGTNYSEMWE